MEKCHLFSSLLPFSHFCHYPRANWAFLVLILGWVGFCTFQDPVDLSSELSCEAGSFSCCHNPHRFFSVRGFEALFPSTRTLGSMFCLAPNCSSLCFHMQMWDCQPPPHLPSPPAIDLL